MEFSSPRKAAEGLLKRLSVEGNDAIPSAVIQAAKTLSTRIHVDTPDEIESHVLELLAAEHRWDCLSVGLYTISEAISQMAPAPVVSKQLEVALYQVIEKHLEHPEPRVRNLISKTLGALCTVPALGVNVYLKFKSQLWSSINHHLSRRQQETMATSFGPCKEIALDDVTGWRALETSLLTLIAIAEGCGPELEALGLLDEEWVSKTVSIASQHQNRYVREASMNMASVLAERCTGVKMDCLAPVVAAGLADPWPQVVYVASKATRSLLLIKASDKKTREVLFPLLLPRLCVSRYFVPEGVQVLSQDTWVALFGEPGGRQAVASQAAEVVTYYCQALGDQSNHFLRIASCYATKELVAKVELSAILPYASQLIEAVIPCLKDAHWEVRSASCAAMAQLAESFPSQIESRSEDIMRLCLIGLEDESWSIREESAMTLVSMARNLATKQLIVDRLLERLRKTILQAKLQPAQTKEEQTRLFNDPKAHTGRVTFGCCGGSLHHQAKKDEHGHEHCNKKERYAAQLWEVSDGAIYLFTELCAEDLRPEGFAEEFLPLLADLTHVQHFPQAENLWQTVWNILPVAAKRLGTRTFKRHLELFTPSLMNALSSPIASQLTRHASITCLEELSQLLGPSIFLGRLPERDRGLFLRSCSNATISNVGGLGGGSVFSSAAATRPSIVSM